MKYLTLKDFISKEKRCFTCGKQLACKEIFLLFYCINSNVPKKYQATECNNNILEFNVNIKYKTKEKIVFSCADNKILQGSEIINNKENISNLLMIECKCKSGVVAELITHESLTNFIKPIIKKKEVLSIYSNNNKCYYYTDFTQNTTHILKHSSTLNQDVVMPKAIDKYDFKNLEEYINHIQMYLNFY